jgi:hypothetical protein
MLSSDTGRRVECPAVERGPGKAASGKFLYTYGGQRLSERVVRRRCGWEDGRQKRAQLTELMVSTGGVFSNAYMAAKLGTHWITAGRVRRLLEDQGLIPIVTVRQCRDGSTRDMSKNICLRGVGE